MAGATTIHFLLWTSLASLFFSQAQQSSYYAPRPPMSPSEAARQECTSYLGRKLFFRFTPVQVENSCDHYVLWGNLTRNGPAMRPKPAQEDYWNKLYKNRKRPLTRMVRKEYRTLTDHERQRFHDAMLNLKRTYVGDMNQYDAIVAFHQPAVAPGAHFGAAFLGWHREFVFRLEQALQKIDAGVTVPYWDSTMDEILGDQARNTIMWTPDFMGNLDGDVVTGPFRNWRLLFPIRNRTRLFRMMVPEGDLFTDTVVDRILNAPDFRGLGWFIDPTIEAVHGQVHDWVGGVLGDLGGSPGDPVFFLLHSWVDYLFEAHRQRQIQQGVDVRFSYPNDSEALGVGRVPPEGEVISSPEESLHLALRPMRPFDGLRNIDGLSSNYGRFYRYAPRPTCSREQPTCGSPYLFCETNREKCAPKLQEGATCLPWANMGPCFKSVCCNGQCSKTCRQK